MNFQWMNESKLEKDGNKLILTAPPKTDFFCGSISECDEGILPAAMCNAPYYYTEVEGDFVLRVKVSHDFASVYDSCALLVMQDMTCWGKLCYELTDFGAHAIVSVVTKGDSDDANGVNLEGDTAWLQICRVGNNFGFHYSADGEHFYMTRYFTLPADPTVKVGLVAQSPQGEGGLRIFEDLTIEPRTVKNIRAGR